MSETREIEMVIRESKKRQRGVWTMVVEKCPLVRSKFSCVSIMSRVEDRKKKKRGYVKRGGARMDKWESRQ